MNTTKIHPLSLLIAFVAGGLFVYYILLPYLRVPYALAGIDSRVTRLEARSIEIENAKTNRQLRLTWVGYALEFAGIVCQLLAKFRFWQ